MKPTTGTITALAKIVCAPPKMLTLDCINNELVIYKYSVFPLIGLSGNGLAVNT